MAAIDFGVSLEFEAGRKTPSVALELWPIQSVMLPLHAAYSNEYKDQKKKKR